MNKYHVAGEKIYVGLSYTGAGVVEFSFVLIVVGGVFVGGLM